MVTALVRLEYEVSRQTGSHIRLTSQRNGEHHITVPAHDPIKIGTHLMLSCQMSLTMLI
ncbi:MAG TPA: type II toxin-antitoxin system HicA family toxin [Waterburya sp.]